ncbi:MAG: hypothetical protein A2W03_06235 [Candidatus Aminicenantes bacterium RBG_16_63_16]|nr:MAG: hypothetical protein A2W03_06235 [Candidatus Aminicenantes bacterium RBG_16_63_16]
MIGFFSMTLRSGLPAQNQKVLLHERASWLAFQELCWVTQLNDGRLARIDPAKDGAESVGILKFSNLLDLGGQGDHSGAIEPTFEELSDGRLFMLIRTNYDQFWTAYSADKGQSWREIRPSGIEASSAPGYLLKLKSGRLLLIWSLLKGEEDRDVKRNALNLNTAEVQASWYRNEVVVAFSQDDGKSWTEPVVLVKSKKEGWPGQISMLSKGNPERSGWDSGSPAPAPSVSSSMNPIS